MPLAGGPASGLFDIEQNGLLSRGLGYLSDEELAQVREILSGEGLKVGALESSLAKVHLPDGDRCFFYPVMRLIW